MPVCQFFKQGNCKFGDRCRNEHPVGLQPPSNANRFGPLGQAQAQQSRGFSAGTQANKRTWPYHLSPDTIKDDLVKERPEWPLSAYGPGRDAPLQLLEGGIDISPEEMRMRFYAARAAGRENQYIEQEAVLAKEAQNQIDKILNDLEGACKYIVDGANTPRDRAKISKESANPAHRDYFSIENQARVARRKAAATSAPSNSFGTSAFGQPSGLGGAQSTFGQPAGQAIGFGQPSGLGQAAAPAQTSAFGQPSLPGQTLGFGQPSALGQGSGFGQTSAMGQSSAFGQPSGLGQGTAFGQPAALGQTSGFGQTSMPGQKSVWSQAAAPAQTSAFGQPSNPGQTSAFGQPSNPGQSAPAFGQPGFGQSGNAGASPFAQNQQAQASNAFGATQPTSTFGQPSQQSTFGQPAGFGQPTTSGDTSSPFAPTTAPPTAPAANPFGQSSSFGQPTTSAAVSSPFSQPTAGPTTNPFGQPAGLSQTTGFSQAATSSSSSPFTQPTAAPTTNPFGQRTSFGQPAGAAAPTPFAQPTAVPASTSFGQPVTAAPSTGLFSRHSATTGGPSNTAGSLNVPKYPPGAPVTSYSTRSADGKRLLTWKGHQVVYKDKLQGGKVVGEYPAYKINNKDYQRIWFPDGPPPPNPWAEGRPEEYEGENGAKVAQAYQFSSEHGYYKDGIMPSVPPKREWISWDL
ncbi:hypothetical protein BU16DRAFT_522599 [Lophium mytilinum]|uniref:C3H1-type domain-containing protein n=1 Tax=Lophium mytilinum TaxID=390894 RepID=A0A6A6RAG6_9PEZI|nr:hypothetical protein BU16DRAFT_522599 [Lophium mytilinum]